MAGKKEKGKKELGALYLKLESLKDLGRSVAGERSYVLALKSGSGYRLMCDGERIGDGKIIYFLDSKQIGRYLVYSADEEHGERTEIVSNVSERADHYKSQRIPIIEISRDPHSNLDKKEFKDIELVEAKEMGGLIRAVINDSGEDEPIKLYSFQTGKERIIGTLTLLKEHNKVFIYSKLASKEPISMVSYDYNSDTVDTSASFDGLAKIRIKVVNLSEQPPFFKS